MPDYLLWYMDSFFRLTQSRQITFGGLWHIPVSEIVCLGEVYSLSGEEMERFIDYIQVIDAEYVAEYAKEHMKQSESKESLNKSVNGKKKTPLGG